MYNVLPAKITSVFTMLNIDSSKTCFITKFFFNLILFWYKILFEFKDNSIFNKKTHMSTFTDVVNFHTII